jgi:hypothetical protein
MQELREACQVLPDGRERRRNLPVSEKLLSSETWRDGAVRAVCEELGSVTGPTPQARTCLLSRRPCRPHASDRHQLVQL